MNWPTCLRNSSEQFSRKPSSLCALPAGTLPRNDNCSGNPAFQRQANTCSVLFLHDLHNDRPNHLRKILAFGRCVQEKVVRLGGTCLKSLVMTWAGKARTQTRLEGRVRKLVRS